jgi:hypothetical protein
MANTQTPNAEPVTISEFIEAHAPFLPRSIVDSICEYKTKFDIFSTEMGRFDESQANAIIDERRKLAGENPTPENIALLGSQSPDEIRKTYAEKRNVFEGLRSACIRQYATPLGRQLLPIIEKLVAEFRLKVNLDFQAFHKRWRIGYDPHSNSIIKATDGWWHHHRDELRREDWARENRYPAHWENLLHHPDFFVGICSRNLTPIDEKFDDTATPSGVSTTCNLGTRQSMAAALKSAADVAAARS